MYLEIYFRRIIVSVREHPYKSNSFEFKWKLLRISYQSSYNYTSEMVDFLNQALYNSINAGFDTIVCYSYACYFFLMQSKITLD